MNDEPRFTARMSHGNAFIYGIDEYPIHFTREELVDLRATCDEALHLLGPAPDKPKHWSAASADDDLSSTPLGTCQISENGACESCQ